MLKTRSPQWRTCRWLSVGRVASALCWPKPLYGPMEVLRSDFRNGLRVACAKPLGAQISACTILFQAGSRLETDDELGASHFIRAASLSTGFSYSRYMKYRYMANYAGYITTSSDRQSIAFTLRCPLPVFNELKWLLLDTATRCRFFDYQLKDAVKARVREDLDLRPSEELVLDLVQKACWGGPLGNSIYCAEGRIGSMTGKVLQGYTDKFFTTNNCTIGSVGLPFEDTLELAEHVQCGKTERPPEICSWPSFPRGGFEVYDKGKGSETWIAIGVPGCGTCDLSCLLAHAILASTCGLGNMQKGGHIWDNTPSYPLGLLAADIYTELKGFNISYTDTGIFGVLLRTKAETAKCVAAAAVKFLCNLGSLNRNDIEIGKRRLKTNLSLHDDNCVKVSEGLALQLAYGHNIDGAKASIAIVDSMDPATVSQTARNISAKMMRGNMAVGVVGDAGQAPHLGELIG